MAAIQPQVGVCHWPHGVSKLMSAWGRNNDLENIMVVCAAGAIDNDYLNTICALVEFIFFTQSLLLYPKHCYAQQKALQEFHHYKNAIIIAGGHWGKCGHIPHFSVVTMFTLEHFVNHIKYIPHYHYHEQYDK